MNVIAETRRAQQFGSYVSFDLVESTCVYSLVIDALTWKVWSLLVPEVHGILLNANRWVNEI
jgi:hypothetical protein